MKIFPTHIIKELDEYTIQHEPIPSIDLMERAARAISEAIVSQWSKEVPVTVFAGPGNNGGDALAVARMLSHKGYLVEVFLFNPKGELSNDCRTNKELLRKTDVKFTEVSTQFVPPTLTESHLVVDGLFGSGLNKPLQGGFAAVVKYINVSPASVVSIDVPSGLMGEDNGNNDRNSIIHADYTLSLQLPKLSFLFAENAEFTGKWSLLDIGISPEVIERTETDFHIIEEDEIRAQMRVRSRFAHKGNFGHGLLIAGSYGMAGASILAARSCIRSGIGLLTAHVPAGNNAILQTTVPEVMTEQDIHENYFAYPTETDDYDAIGIGPGLGKSKETEFAVLEQIRSCDTHMVIDADALNILSTHRQTLLTKIPSGSILTPHPKELERLVGKCRNSYDRLMKARELAAGAKVHIVLKGAYTVIITPEGKCSFNPTGNPGMATGGSGDVLTGIILALLAQGYKAEVAAKTGAYIHGLAGDIAKEKQTETGMTASDIIDSLPQAWKQITG